MHIKSAIMAARSGSNIFLEKPLSNSLIGINELKKILRAKKNHVYVGYQLRFNPVIKKLKKIIDKKLIGNIVSVRSEVTEYMPGFHKYENYKKSYASLKKLGGGVILTQIHEIDYLQWIFGTPKNIYALGGKLSNLEIDVEDSASLLMCCDKGGVLIPINLYMDFLQKNNRRNCIVYGTEGRIEADLKNLSLELIQDNKSIKKYSWKSFDRNQQFIQQLKHFLKVVENKEKPLVDFNEGLKSLKIALAAKKSINTGKIIKIKY
jgi:predicted dehydrogenase